MTGWVYILTNAATPKLVKVGFTERDPELRAKELSGTGVPGELSVEFAEMVEDPRLVEREAHRLLSNFHYDKEWFKCTIRRAQEAIEQAIEEAIEEAIDEERTESYEDYDGPLVPGHPSRGFL